MIPLSFEHACDLLGISREPTETDLRGDTMRDETAGNEARFWVPSWDLLRNAVCRFLLMTEADAMSAFAGLPGAEVGRVDMAATDRGRSGAAYYLPKVRQGLAWVFVPGNLPEASRVLLVAHADTVRGDPPPSLEHSVGGRVIRASDGGVLGADNRAGMAALWTLRDLGHSILITTGEETGGWGAEQAAEDIPEALGAHCFAVQIDRRGGHQAVVYGGTNSADFKRWISARFPGWWEGFGTYTDIATICPVIRRCGVNLSAGFTGEHMKGETLDVDALYSTTARLAVVLQDRAGLEVFEPSAEWQGNRYPGFEWEGETYLRNPGPGTGWSKAKTDAKMKPKKALKKAAKRAPKKAVGKTGLEGAIKRAAEREADRLARSAIFEADAWEENRQAVEADRLALADAFEALEVQPLDVFEALETGANDPLWHVDLDTPEPEPSDPYERWPGGEPTIGDIDTLSNILVTWDGHCTGGRVDRIKLDDPALDWSALATGWPLYEVPKSGENIPDIRGSEMN